MIVFDLEWNSGMYDRVTLNEILQIGAVKLTAPGGRIVSTFNAYIRPTVHKRYSPGVAKLPDLERYEKSHLDCRTAIKDFAAWCGDDQVFATWGDGDFTVLKQNLAYWKVDFPIPDTYLDLQIGFGAVSGAKGHVALGYAVEYCQLPDIFDYHNSMHDALYTALVSEWLSEETLALCVRVPGAHKEKATAGLPKGRRWIGPFGDRDQLLNSRGCRLAVCPACGTKGRVTRWAYGERDTFWASFRCPDHGDFFLRLELGKNKKGQLWGSTKVMENTPRNRQLFDTAVKKGVFLCHGRRRGHSGWRRRRRWGKPKESGV